LRGPVQELDLGSDDEDDEPRFVPSKQKKSKQSERPLKIIPTSSSDSSDSEASGECDDDGPTTMANMEARSRALDAKAAAAADLDAEELQDAAITEEDDDDVDTDGAENENGDIDVEPFHLPTAEERENEKNGGTDIHVVQRRMRECVRVLGKFKRLAEKGR
jgi:hypothetical protein